MNRKNAALITAAVGIACTILAGADWHSGLEGLFHNGAPYRDEGGIWSDCYGNTVNVDPNKVRPLEECKALLTGEANRLGNEIYKKLERPVSATTLAAFISFAYNIGINAFNSSTLLKLWNEGDYLASCQQMFRWVYIKGKYSPGLYKRRKIEYQYCAEGIND